MLPEKIANWPPRWRELYEERAAIIEYEAMLPRSAAEFWAEQDIRKLAKEAA